MEGLTRGKKLFAAAFGVFITVPLSRYALHPIWTDLKKRKERTAIITGATGNLGTALTYQLAKRGVRIIMACRDMDKCRTIRREIVLKTGHKGIACRQLDLENIDSINRFARQMIETEPHIDILINNAAVKEVKEKEITKYGVEKNYFVNFLAPFLLTFLLMEKLKESSMSTRDSRIINVIGTPKSSWDVDLEDINFEKRQYNPKTAYNQSKMALAYFTILLDKLLRDEKSLIWVYGTGPGTKFIGKIMYLPSGSLDRLKNSLKSFYTVEPDRVVFPMVYYALEPSVADKSHSGGLYLNNLPSFGWYKAGKDENKAKLVWNSASKLLLTPK